MTLRQARIARLRAIYKAYQDFLTIKCAKPIQDTAWQMKTSINDVMDAIDAHKLGLLA